MTFSTQYEIVTPNKSKVFTNVEESAIKRFLAVPGSRLFIRGWYENDDKTPPTERLDITEIIRKAIAQGRGRG
jgi:hypothetical protein